MRTTISAFAICVVFLAGNESIRVAHNRMLFVWLPDIYTEHSRLSYRDPCRIAFIGDSILMTGLDPSVIPDSYNFGWLGASYIANYVTLEWMIRSHPRKLKVIVLPLDRHSFAGERFGYPISFENAPLNIVVRAEIRDHQHGLYLRPWVRDRLFPYADFPRKIAELPIGDPPVRRKGFAVITDHIAKSPAEFEASAQNTVLGLFGSEPWFDDRMAWYLDAMLQLASENDLKVVLIQSPMTRQFDAALQDRVPQAMFDAHQSAVLTKFPDVIVLNYRDRFFDQPELFYNANHLHVSGARKFSYLLRDDLERLGYITP